VLGVVSAVLILFVSGSKALAWYRRRKGGRDGQGS
jgi:hypothetical protein